MCYRNLKYSKAKYKIYWGSPRPSLGFSDWIERPIRLSMWSSSQWQVIPATGYKTESAKPHRAKARGNQTSLQFSSRGVAPRSSSFPSDPLWQPVKYRHVCWESSLETQLLGGYPESSSHRHHLPGKCQNRRPQGGCRWSLWATCSLHKVRHNENKK